MAKSARKVRRVVIRSVLIVVLVVVVACAGSLVWDFTRPGPPPIPGNHRTSTESHPWIMDIRRQDGGGGQPGDKVCVGTLVAPRVVITAAHCLFGHSPGEFQVTGGRTDLRIEDGTTRKVASLWVAPAYGDELKKESFFSGIFGKHLEGGGDLGLLTLREDMPYAALPIATGAQARPGGGTPADHFGWRVSPRDEPVLWQETTAIVDDGTCARRADEAIRSMPSVFHGYSYDRNSYLCAGIGSKALNIRPTDSGSPLVVNGKLVGVTSWNPGKDPRLPDFFTRLDPYLTDINRHLGTGTA